MVSKTGRCYTPTSLWNEFKKVKKPNVKLLVVKKNEYEIDYVVVNER